MTTKSRRYLLIGGIVAAGCGGANPFVSARFAGGFQNAGQGGGSSTQPTTRINSTCDLAANRKVLGGIGLVNVAQQRVSYSMTLLASAGTGGFVCDADRNSYLTAGYRPLPLDAVTRTATIGCDPVPLLRGTELLALRASGTINADTSAGTNPPLAASPLNGAVRIPVPEVIVLGDSNTIFVCQGNNACTQGGFVYTDLVGNAIAKVTASRTQGTICNVRAGNLPEWRMLDPNFTDTQRSSFNYTTGSSIAIVVLDRAANSDPNTNQVVWQIVSVDGVLLQDFLP